MNLLPDAELRHSVHSLLRTMMVFRNAADRCLTRVQWARNHGRPITPIAALDFDIIYSLFVKEDERDGVIPKSSRSLNWQRRQASRKGSS